MQEMIREISYMIGVEPFWIWVIIGTIALLFIVGFIYPWTPKWKSKKTKDKDGNEVTIYYHLDF